MNIVKPKYPEVCKQVSAKDVSKAHVQIQESGICWRGREKLFYMNEAGKVAFLRQLDWINEFTFIQKFWIIRPYSTLIQSKFRFKEESKFSAPFGLF